MTISATRYRAIPDKAASPASKTDIASPVFGATNAASRFISVASKPQVRFEGKIRDAGHDTAEFFKDKTKAYIHLWKEDGTFASLITGSVLGLTALLGWGGYEGISWLVDNQSSQIFIAGCQEKSGTEVANCMIPGLDSENYQIRDAVIRQIKDLPVNEQEKARLFLKALRENNLDNYDVARNELSQYLERGGLKNQTLTKALQNLLEAAPETWTETDEVCVPTQNAEICGPYTTKYRVAYSPEYFAQEKIVQSEI